MNQEKIIQAIAAYLERETIITGVPGEKAIEFGGVLNQGHFTHAGFCREVAEELAAAIAPHLEAGAGWENAPSWAEWRTVDKHGAVLYWENEPVPDDENGFWVHRINDADGDFEYSNHLADWKNCKQQRPR